MLIIRGGCWFCRGDYVTLACPLTDVHRVGGCTLRAMDTIFKLRVFQTVRTMSCAMVAVLLMALALSVATSCGSAPKSSARVTTHSTKGHRGASGSPAQWPTTGAEKPTYKYQKGLMETARTWLGTPYVYGGQTKEGADCSGFVLEVYKAATGIKLPRTSYNMADYCISLKREDLVIGDLIFFSGAKTGGNVGHVGMYIGNNQMVHASYSRGVIVSSLDETYYTKYYHSAGRVPAIAQMLPSKKKPRGDNLLVEPERQLAAATPAVQSRPSETVSRPTSTPATPPSTERVMTLNELIAADLARHAATEPPVTPSEAQGEQPLAAATTSVSVQPVVQNVVQPAAQSPLTQTPVAQTPAPAPEPDGFTTGHNDDPTPETMVINAFAGIKANN